MMDRHSMNVHFAKEALTDAMQTNENQIFLSASKAESDTIRHHVIDFAKVHGLSLSGNPLILPNGAMLAFLQTDTQTCGGYSGNAYIINCFDEANYSYVNALASSWTVLKKHRAVFFSIDNETI